MNAADTTAFVEHLWDTSIVPALVDYIRIPNQSPDFDPDWAAHGHMDRAVELARAWVEARAIPGARIEVLRLEGRTPLLLVEVPGQREGTVLMYGHLDKQPPFSGWHEGLGPWTPVYRDGKLYGRGAADDGYAVFASCAAIAAVQAQGIAHPRVVMAIECCEESGSGDLPVYMKTCADRIGRPDLVVCLDSGAGDYERMWVTTSLRGLVGGDLKVEVLDHGVHSGDASGVVPSSFRIARALVDRIESATTGRVKLESLHVPIPDERMRQARLAAEVLGDSVWSKYGLMGSPMSADAVELILNRTWRPTLSVTGAEGLPPLAQAGNVLRPYTTLRLSIRIPPHVDPERATAEVKNLLERDPPYGARVRLVAGGSAPGWEAPATAPWLEEAMRAASEAHFGVPYAATFGHYGTTYSAEGRWAAEGYAPIQPLGTTSGTTRTLGTVLRRGYPRDLRGVRREVCC
jgi:acetylornithine deacetylase/succinyl-diaminopimelate desuccinylase-like protein